MINNKKVTAIILAAGSSTRFGTNTNKNLELLNGKTIISYSIEAFSKSNYVDDIIVVIRESDQEKVQEIVGNNSNVKIVKGGETRSDSVFNALNNTDSDIVIIHDGARPNIKERYITSCLQSMEEYDGVTIGVPSIDTIKIVNDNMEVVETTKRKNTYIIQTPQCFKRKVLLTLLEKNRGESLTDDCMLLEQEHHKVKVLEGDYTNLKITKYTDLKIMKNLI